MSNFEYRIKQQEDNLQKLKENYETARDFTAEVLAKAQELGIDAVGIGKTDKSVQESPWSEGRDCDLFAKGYQKIRQSDGTERNGGCIVWRLAEDMDIYAGCGNNDQAQISGAAQSKLINGIYHFEDGKWTLQS